MRQKPVVFHKLQYICSVEYKKDRSEDRTLGTPNNTADGLEVVTDVWTYCVGPLRYDVIHLMQYRKDHRTSGGRRIRVA